MPRESETVPVIPILPVPVISNPLRSKSPPSCGVVSPRRLTVDMPIDSYATISTISSSPAGVTKVILVPEEPVTFSVYSADSSLTPL